MYSYLVARPLRRILPVVSFVLISLLILRPDPSAAFTVALTGPTEIISAGAYHTCALTPAGAVDCWGADWYGEGVDQPGPYTQISAGYNHTCALTPSGAVDCWGGNEDGQATDQPGPYIQVSAGTYITCALVPSGAVECWGKNGVIEIDDQPGPYTQISAGDAHACGLTPSGAVDCWGANLAGESDHQPGPYVQVSAGGTHTCALTVDGAADCWGYNFNGNTEDRPGPYTQINAGGHTCALTLDGAADCWGSSQPGPYTQVSNGAYHTCALTPAGAADCWGDNTDGEATDQPGPYGPYVPEASLTSTPPPLTGDNDPSFEFASPSPSATFECRLDGGPWEACTSPKSYTDLSEGEHTFEVRASDATGNPVPTPTSYTWTISPVAFFVSTDSAGSIGPLSFGPHDILQWSGGAWSKWFDGSAAGLMPKGQNVHNVMAFWIPDPGQPDVVMTFSQNRRQVPGLPGYVDGMDIVWWNGSAFSLWFDGQDVGLADLTKEKIDALHVLDGSTAPPALAAAAGGSCLEYLLISTQAAGQVPKYSGGAL